MKKIILSTLLLLSANFHSQASTYNAMIVLLNQSMVDSFSYYYPSVTEINNTLMIGPSSGTCNISNLNGLSGLTSVKGLYIQHCANLINLNSLSFNVLGGVNYQISINDNPALLNISGFNGMVSFAGSIFIFQNPSLNIISGFNNLQTIGGQLNIQNNLTLSSLAGLYSLNSIGGLLSISGSGSLTSLEGLTNLSSIGSGVSFGNAGSLVIYDNPALSSLTALSNLTSINGSLNIYHTALTTLSGLENLSPIGVGNKYITYNSLLSQCAIPAICASP